MPPGLRPTLGVFQAALELTSQCELHPDLVSQTFGYLFFFSNASLLNSLMERGEGQTGEGAGWKAQEPLRPMSIQTPRPRIGLMFRDPGEQAPDPKLKDRKGLGGRRAQSMHSLPFISCPTGQGRPFYQWSRAVQIRTNLDLVLDWLQGAGLGDIATEFFRKLSIAVNLLCVPRTSLLKVTPIPDL